MRRLKEDIKSRSFHKAYLLYGEEEYLKKLYSDSLRKAVLGDGDKMNYSCFEGKDIDVARVRDTADTLPFFSDYRIITIKESGFFKSSGELADYLPKMPDTTVAVFVEKEVDKRNRLYKYVNKEGIAVEMNQMSLSETKKFVGMILKENGKKMRERAVEYLLQQIDGSAYAIINEMDKLISYTWGRDEITVDDIDKVCCVHISGQIFKMIDCAAMGKKEDALRLYRDLLTLRENPMSILYLIARHFNIILQIKQLDGAPKNEIASKVSIPPFAVGKYLAQAKRFDEAGVKSLLDECVETEYRFKRGLMDGRMGVELLLSRIVSLS